MLPQAFHRQTQSQQPASSSFMPNDIMTTAVNAESLREHILSHQAYAEFADCQVEVVDEHGGTPPVFDAHRIILSRSPTLLDLIRDHMSANSPNSDARLHVRLSGKYLRARSVMEGVRYLYGATLQTPDAYSPGPIPGPQVPYNEERMKLALQHIAAAAWLRLPAFGYRGVDAASGLLHWDTVAFALAFAMNGGLGTMWAIDDGSEERTSTCSSDDSMAKQEVGGSPTFDPYATTLLHRILDFIVHALPPNFYLDAVAPQLESCARLPTATPGHLSRSSQSDPRLSKIRFGEVPVEDLQRPSLVTTTISSILLSLPFPLLKFLLEHPNLAHRLGSETVASIMRQVVNEREVRRRKALEARTVSSHAEDGTDNSVVQNLYWEEHVEQSIQHRAGSRLGRRRRGIDTPASSGAESERTKV